MSSATGRTERPDPETVARRLRRQARRQKRQQLTAGMAKFDESQRAELESLCDRLALRLLARPLAALDLAAERDDRELARAVATLFGVEDTARGTVGRTEHERTGALRSGTET